MKNQIIENILVYYNDYELDKNTELKEILISEKLSSFLKKLNKDTIVILWWDWTFLEVIKTNYKENKSFLWINFWTKWFLLNEKSILDKDVEFTNTKYSLLECIVNNKKTICFNEFDIKASLWKMLWVDIIVDENNKLNILWDWLIISTPAWSTWYNASLSGPILPHDLNVFIITPKAPWKPRQQSPIILNDNVKVVLKTTWRQVPVEIYSDGKIFETLNNEKENIIKIKKSKYKINLLTTKENENIWKNKVLEEQGFSYEKY